MVKEKMTCPYGVRPAKDTATTQRYDEKDAEPEQGRRYQQFTVFHHRCTFTSSLSYHQMPTRSSGVQRLTSSKY